MARVRVSDCKETKQIQNTEYQCWYKSTSLKVTIKGQADIAMGQVLALYVAKMHWTPDTTFGPQTISRTLSWVQSTRVWSKNKKQQLNYSHLEANICYVSKDSWYTWKSNNIKSEIEAAWNYYLADKGTINCFCLLGWQEWVESKAG